MGRVIVPSGTNMAEVKEFCRQNLIPTRTLSPDKWCKVLSQLDIPNGGIMDDARLPVMRAALKG